MIIRNGSKWIRIISQRNRVSITTAVGGYSKDAHDSYSYYMIDKVRMRSGISGPLGGPRRTPHEMGEPEFFIA